MHKAWCCLGAQCLIDFQGQLSNFKVTRLKKSSIRPKLGVSGLYLQFEFTDGYEMMLKSWSSIEEVPYCQGHPWNFKVTRDKCCWFWAELSISGLSLQFEFTDGFEMIYKAWSSIEEVPYCLARSSIKFQGHTGQNCQFWPKISVSGL